MCDSWGGRLFVIWGGSFETDGKPQDEGKGDLKDAERNVLPFFLLFLSLFLSMNMKRHGMN